MKLFEMTGAPNPRRVRIFLAEKGIDDIEYVQVDMAKREHKSAEFLARNPSGKIPVLELDDGSHIAESVAICRYIEALHPEPNLFGADPAELGRIEMHNRIIELELWTRIGTSWVNGEVVAQMGLFEQIPAAKAQSDAATNAFYRRLDTELQSRAFIAGERFTIADISALTAVDFATALVELKPDDSLTSLWRWHAEVSGRPSASA